ncbi:MAG: cysteine peptidase family C39 domain-containing protein [Phycisphaerales bacterium]|nr:cysteine peptidase family C39 domain-containing protein [Phycisphaerales bacterium]
MVWMKLVAVLMLVVIGGSVGRRLGKSRWWWVGFAGSLLLVSLVIVGRRSVYLSFVWPFSWAISPHVGPLMMGMAIPVMLGVLMVRLPERRKRVMVGILAGAMLVYFGLLPVVLPLAVRGSLLGTATVVDHDGVCWQQHNYSCGPAAAVTCLRMLGVEGQEGLIGALAETAPTLGTDGQMLAAAVEKLYGGKGVQCTYRYVSRIEELRTPAVAAIQSPKHGGHYVAVLKVEDNAVIVGDPINGKERWGRQEFLDQWRGAAVEILPP